MKEPEDTPSNSALGATGDDLRLWLAKEAVRHGEVRLAAQQSNMAAMETRATALFGWSVPTILALGAAALSSRYGGAALLAAVCLTGVLILCAVALWPRIWRHAGYTPNALLDENQASELQVLESIAGGYALAVEANDVRLKDFGQWLRAAWMLFIIAPFAGGIGLLVTMRL